VEKENNAAKVSVRDSGPGIPREQQGQIFDRYFRGNGAGNHVSGLGLGLYISADIIYRHQGEIGVISEPGEGATFWFTLPLQ
jgi:signal transduction histidine kinase